MRDPHTLEPLGEYLLLFSSPSSSHAYWNHVRQQHQLSRVHTPNSLSTQLAPPPGYLVDGQDVHALLQDYALKPPTSQLRLRRLESPLPPHLRNLVNQGGYPELISSETNSSYPILFTVDGAQPSYYDIKQAIHQDGKDRGLMWTALTSKNSIRKFETATPKSEDEADENIFDGREKAPSYARYKPARWILSFQSEAEAQRFVRTWHRREFPLPRGSSTYGEPPPMINAEILW